MPHGRSAVETSRQYQFNLSPSPVLVKRQLLKPKGSPFPQTEAAIKKFAEPYRLSPDQLRLVMEQFPDAAVYPSMAIVIRAYMDDGMNFEEALNNAKRLEGT